MNKLVPTVSFSEDGTAIVLTYPLSWLLEAIEGNIEFEKLVALARAHMDARKPERLSLKYDIVFGEEAES